MRRSSVRIDETLLGAGDVVALAPGPHTAGFVEDATGGMLVLALDDPPGPAPLAVLQGVLMRVALLTNILPVYRVPVFRALAATPGWQLRVFLSSGSECPRTTGSTSRW